MEKESILNIGAGKGLPIDLNFRAGYFLVNLDPGYEEERCKSIKEIEELHNFFNMHDSNQQKIMYSYLGWKDFIPNYFKKFDRVVMYRYLEHVPMVEIPFFIYMVSTMIEPGGIVEGIVPNYKILAEMILKEDPFSIDFEKQNILTTTEIVNEPYDPHASIWTPDRVKYFFELENRFENVNIKPRFHFDDRDIYIRFFATRKLED